MHVSHIILNSQGRKKNTFVILFVWEVCFLSNYIAGRHFVTASVVLVIVAVAAGVYYIFQGGLTAYPPSPSPVPTITPSTTSQPSTMPEPVVETARNWAG